MRVLIGCLLLATAWGCGSKTTVATGPNGEKVTADTSGNMTVDDGKGGRVDVKTDGENWTSKAADGSELNVSKDGFTGTNEKGEKFSMGTSSVSEPELGVPFYPGSGPVAGRDMKVDGDGKKTLMSVRSTNDAPAKVAEFYKGKIEGATTTTSPQLAIVGGKLKNGDEIVITVSAVDGKSEIAVSVTHKG